MTRSCRARTVFFLFLVVDPPLLGYLDRCSSLRPGLAVAVVQWHRDTTNNTTPPPPPATQTTPSNAPEKEADPTRKKVTEGKSPAKERSCANHYSKQHPETTTAPCLRYFLLDSPMFFQLGLLRHGEHRTIQVEECRKNHPCCGLLIFLSRWPIARKGSTTNAATKRGKVQRQRGGFISPFFLFVLRSPFTVVFVSSIFALPGLKVVKTE